MTLNIKELIERARKYVEIEANAEVLEVKFEESFTLFGQEDVVLAVTIADN